MYSHDNKVDGKSHCFNCYGFVLHLIKQTNPIAYHALVNTMYDLKETIPISIDGLPCPANLIKIFQCKSSHWSKIENLGEVQGGDIIVYTPKGYTLTKQFNSKTFGNHAMLILEVLPQKNDEHCFSVIEYTRRGKKATPIQKSVVHIIPTTVRWKTRRYRRDIVFARIRKASL